MDNAQTIDQVVISKRGDTISLRAEGRKWTLNDTYTANLARMNDLLIVLKDVNARRKAAQKDQSTLKKQLETEGVNVRVYEKNQLVHSFFVDENEKGTLTYFMVEGGEVYIVNIPGHTYHVADLFKFNTQDWRTKYIFAAN